MKSKLLKLLDIILVVFQSLVSINLIYKLRLLLPLKVLFIIAVLFLIFATLMIQYLFIKKKKLWFTRLVSSLICICLIFASFIVRKSLNTLNNITDSHEESTMYSVIVLDESNYESLIDLNKKNIGICTEYEESTFTEVLDDLTNQITFKQVDKDSINDLYQALMNKEVDAIVLNEGLRSTIEEIDEDFSRETRNVYQYQLSSAIQVIKDNTLSVTKEPFNIFISGIDTYGPVATRSRSDVNMIVTVNPVTKTILMTSIPRDYYVTLATFNAKDKLTHAGLYGVNESITTLENLFEIDIQYYIRVNFTSLTTMVDALDGITVYNPEEFTSLHTQTYYPIGNIEMNGNMALEFARERYGLSNGDRSRVLNQQRVLEAMLKKAMSKTIIYNYNKVLSAISGCFETNMSSEEIQSLIQMQLNDMSDWHFKSQSVDGNGNYSTTCYSYPGPALYVMEPDESTVTEASLNIKAILE